MANESIWNDESESVRRAQAETFATLYARWYDNLVDYCDRIGCGPDDPEEVAQEAFLKAWTAWQAFEEDRPFWPWLSTIAKRCCMDRWRRRQRDSVRERQLRSRTEITVPTPEMLAEEAEERKVVALAFSRLRPGEQRVMGLQALEDWSYNDIAAFEQVTVESVRATLRRSRLAMRTACLRAFEGSLAAAPLIRLHARLRDRIRLAVARARQALPADAALAERAGLAAGAAATLVMALVAVPVDVPASDARASAASGRSADAAQAKGPGGTLTADRAAAIATGAHGGRARPDPKDTVPVEGGAIPRLPLDGATQPDDAVFQQFVPASGDPTGRTVFATGLAHDCEQVTCPAIFKSTDGGATWVRLPASGYLGGSLLVPPAYPADRRLYVVNGVRVFSSTDDGANFKPTLSVGGNAAMSPAFSSGDPRILVAAGNAWEYRADVGSAVPLSWSTTSRAIDMFAYSPSFPTDPRILVAGAEDAVGPFNPPSQVRVCTPTGCGPPVVLEGSVFEPSGIRLSPSFAHDGIAFVWRSERLYRSTDGGASFSQITAPMADQAVPIGEVTFARDGAVYTALHGYDADNKPVGGVFVSRDAGQSWTALGIDTVLSRGAITIASLGNGNLLAAPTDLHTIGLQCSADGGRSWAPRCPQTTP